VLLVLGMGRRGGDVATGLFHCPGCGGDRGYRLRRPRAWGRLPRMPALSSRAGGAVVCCDTCAGRFSPTVLDVPTAARLEELLWRGTRTAAVYVLTGVLAGSGLCSPDENRRVVAVLRHLLGPEYGPELLSADLAAHREGSDLHVLGQLGAHLAPAGADHLLRGLADLVLAVRSSACADWHRLRDVAAALGVGPAHLSAVVQEASARTRE
jgi:hypothetical protein